ncbi:MAG: (2Fe-2S) ferredoxin domain-containing protein [Armatimonadota bacterium]
MVSVKCCVGSSCHIRGGAKTLKALNSLIAAHNLESKVELVADLCLDNCIQAPNVMVDGVTHGGITPDKAEAFFTEHILERVT